MAMAAAAMSNNMGNQNAVGGNHLVEGGMGAGVGQDEVEKRMGAPEWWVAGPPQVPPPNAAAPVPQATPAAN